VDAQAKIDANQNRAQREASILVKSRRSCKLSRTTTSAHVAQAVINAVDLTTRREDEAPRHGKRAQLLPLASSIPLTPLEGHKALDEGIAAFATPSRTTATDRLHPQSTPLLEEDRVDTITVMLGVPETVLAKLNGVPSQTLWGPFTSHESPVDGGARGGFRARGGGPGRGRGLLA
jgi:hypothetical protein